MAAMSAIMRKTQDGFVLYSQAKTEEEKKEAMGTIAEANQNLIWQVINHHFGSFSGHKEDMYQEGMLGLIKAIPKYDAKKGAHTTFFYPYIVHEISRYISQFIQGTTTHYADKITVIKRAAHILESKGVEINEINLHAETGIPMETISACMQIDRLRSSAISMDSEEFSDANENVAERTMLTPEEEVLIKERTDILEECIQTLSREEQLCIRYKYGILGCPAFSHGEISKVTEIPLNKVRGYIYAAERHLKKTKMASYDKEETVEQRQEVATVPIELAMQQMKELEEDKEGLLSPMEFAFHF